MIPAFINNKDFRWLSCVYEIKNNITGTVYIGQTDWLQIRIQRHRYLLRTNSHYNSELQNDYNAHGENSFSITILHKSKDSDEKMILERAEISKSKFCYNIIKCKK